ncbi:unnamed protein product [Protopolystoma xenopodis]|uniref:Uncharacterized protein n=1 Tax=Protopolystoma xenopodis TaxID=117903 RepID=A0A3S5CVF1_9PLAT|nr:unnamed protein product [Protopolystoma xenopodis]
MKAIDVLTDPWVFNEGIVPPARGSYGHRPSQAANAYPRPGSISMASHGRQFGAKMPVSHKFVVLEPLIKESDQEAKRLRYREELEAEVECVNGRGREVTAFEGKLMGLGS